MTNTNVETSFISSVESGGIVVVTLDQPGSSANILSDEMFDQLEAAITPWIDRTDLRGLILISGKPKIFVAGANLVAINESLDLPDEEMIAWCDRGRDVMSLLRRASMMTVAAIHGACVGGGFELTLWCDRRVATDDRRTVIGLPESKLGLVPGWGGTFHVARIGAIKNGADAAMEQQLEMVLGGGLLSSAEAEQAGLIDLVVSAHGNAPDENSLLDAARALIDDEWNSDEYKGRRKQIERGFDPAPDAEALARKFAPEIVNRREIYAFAPTVALEHMIRASSLSLKDAADSESRAMAQVYGSPASYGLINNFFLGDHNRKHPGLVDLSLTSRKIERVGIVGAGLMGRLIAMSNLNAGIEVVLLDSDNSRAQAVAGELENDKTKIETADTFQAFSTCNLVIETAVENSEIKKTILAKIEAAVPGTTLIATNTSAIPVTELAEGMKHPDRFCGVHFCHPTLMMLVEVIRGEQTADETVADAVAYNRSIRKMPVAVADRAGFVVNRLLSALLDQSLRLFGEGHSLMSIDGAMRQFGFESGPFEMVDIIGADTCLHAGQSMWTAGLKCVSKSLVLPRLVKLGRTGRKSGAGFYKYETPGSLPTLDPDVLPILEPYVSGSLSPNSELQSGEPEARTRWIIESVLAATALEASRILDDEIVADHRDIDLAIINGFSFPKHEGGILFWADRQGAANIVETLEEIAATEPRLSPTERLIEMSRTGSRFYAM